MQHTTVDGGVVNLNEHCMSFFSQGAMLDAQLVLSGLLSPFGSNRMVVLFYCSMSPLSSEMQTLT